MIQIPADLRKAYNSFIEQRGVKAGLHQYYIKWLRYYLDFCHKYNLKQTAQEGLVDFTGKLKEKKQPENLRKQAHHAIALFGEMEEYCPGRKPHNETCSVSGTTAVYASSKTSLPHTKENKENLISQAVPPDYIYSDLATPSHAGKILPRTSELKQSGADWMKYSEIFRDRPE